MVTELIERQQIATWFKGLQDRICQGLEGIDGKAQFITDEWQREGGGGGRSRVIANGNVFEKGGVMFSAVEGTLPEKISKALNVTAASFFATGVSIVIHPASPKVPIIHMNTRYFELDNGTFWFGGGIDLTPIYVVEEDAMAFHAALKATCDKTDAAFYPEFKTWADDYFYLKNRKETRGIGGIFYDRLGNDNKHSQAQLWAFTQNVGNTFLEAYRPIAERHKNEAFTEQEKQWQQLRRGRYVEFNLLYDKGTKFGLDTDGRTESILVSMPPVASWVYNFKPENASAEAKTLQLLKKGISWI